MSTTVRYGALISGAPFFAKTVSFSCMQDNQASADAIKRVSLTDLQHRIDAMLHDLIREAFRDYAELHDVFDQAALGPVSAA